MEPINEQNVAIVRQASDIDDVPKLQSINSSSSSVNSGNSMKSATRVDLSRVDSSRHHLVVHESAGRLPGTDSRRYSEALGDRHGVAADRLATASPSPSPSPTHGRRNSGAVQDGGEHLRRESQTVIPPPKPRPKVDKVARALGQLKGQFTKCIEAEDEKEASKNAEYDKRAMERRRSAHLASHAGKAATSHWDTLRRDTMDTSSCDGTHYSLTSHSNVERSTMDSLDNGSFDGSFVHGRVHHEEEEYNPWGDWLDMEVTQEDKDQFYMWSSRHRQFLVLFITKWRNTSFNKKRGVESRAWGIWLEFNAMVEIELHNAFVLKTAKDADEILRARDVEKSAMPTHKRRGSVADLRSNEQIDCVTSWLKMFNSELLGSMDKNEMRQMATHALVRHYKPNEMLFLQGWEGDEFYIILEGTLRLYTHSDDFKKMSVLQEHTKVLMHEREKTGTAIDYLGGYLGNVIVDLHAGAGFGELAFISDHKFRSASGAWLEPAKVLVVNETLYNKTLHKYHQARYELNDKKNMIQCIKLFTNWKDSQILAICAAIKKTEYRPGHVICAQGDTVNDVVMIATGEVLMTKRVSFTTSTIPPKVKEVSVEVARCGNSTLLGDLEIMRSRSKYMETSVCTGVVTACVISAKNFEKLILRVSPKLGSCASLYESVKGRCAFRKQRLLSEIHKTEEEPEPGSERRQRVVERIETMAGLSSDGDDDGLVAGRKVVRFGQAEPNPTGSKQNPTVPQTHTLTPRPSTASPATSPIKSAANAGGNRMNPMLPDPFNSETLGSLVSMALGTSTSMESDVPTSLQDSYAKNQRRPMGPTCVDVGDPQVQANRTQMMRTMNTIHGETSLGFLSGEGSGGRGGGGDGESVGGETTSSHMSMVSRASSKNSQPGLDRSYPVKNTHTWTVEKGSGRRKANSKMGKMNNKKLTGSARAPEQIMRGTLGGTTFRRASYVGPTNGKGLFNVEHEILNHATLPPMNDVISWGAQPLVSRSNSCIGPSDGFSPQFLGNASAPKMKTNSTTASTRSARGTL